MVNDQVPAGAVLRVRGVTNPPRLYIGPSTGSSAGVTLRTPQRPLLIRTPGLPGPQGPPGGVEKFEFSGTGTEFVRTGNHFVILEVDYTVISVRATIGLAPLGTGLVVDIIANGASIYGNTAYRPTIPALGRSGLGGPVAPTVLHAGTALSVNVAAVGATRPGDNLVVAIRLAPTGTVTPVTSVLPQMVPFTIGS